MQTWTGSRLLFAGDLEDSKSTSGETLSAFGSHTFVPISWMCKKQTSVSHSSTESEIISLDTGLRLDGLPALDLWDLIVSVLGNVFSCFRWIRGNLRVIFTNVRNLTTKSMWWETLIWFPQMFNPQIVKALLYEFEDNEAEIKMIIQGRSPTMIHVSKTHRVALDWLFDGMNLDHQKFKSSMSTPNTTVQTYGENDISHAMSGTIFFICWASAISALCCAQNFSWTNCTETMAKRMQIQEGQGRIVEKS